VAGNPRIDELRKKLEKEPGSRLFAQLAEELRKDGEYEDAIRVAREGLQKHPNYPSARMTLGRALFDTGDWDAARSEFEQVLKGAPDNILASRLLAESLESLGDVTGALARYKKTLGLAPGDKQVMTRLEALEKRAGTGAPAPVAPGAAPALAAPAGRTAVEAPPPSPPPPVAPIKLVEVDTPMELERSHEPGAAFEPAPPAPAVHVPAPTAPPLAPPVAAAPEPVPIPLAAADTEFELERVAERPIPPPPPAPVAAPAPPPPRPAPVREGGEMEFDFDAGPTGGAMPFAPAPAPSRVAPPPPEPMPAPAPMPAEAVPPPQAYEADTFFEEPPAEASAAGPAPMPAPPAAPHPPVFVEPPVPTPPMVAAPAPFEAPPPAVPPAPVAPATVEPPPPQARAPEPSRPQIPSREPELVSPTLAELYFKQGFTDKAADVYRQLLEREPDNDRLRRRLAELQSAGAAVASPPPGRADAAVRKVVLERTIARLEGMLASLKKG
jgi:tetratricopeptide (TPR) repeat protein